MVEARGEVNGRGVSKLSDPNEGAGDRFDPPPLLVGSRELTAESSYVLMYTPPFMSSDWPVM